MYNARKRGEDRASDYFKRTENVAGVKDMRFQALMPDILHWLGITKIDRMLSMSKYVQTDTNTKRESHTQRDRDTHTHVLNVAQRGREGAVSPIEPTISIT